MNKFALPDLMLEPLVRNALLEDLGACGDITTQATIPADTQWRAALVARKAGVVAGLDLARLAFHLVDPKVVFKSDFCDGAMVASGNKLAVVSGSARSLLSAERVALNFLSHLSGIATATRSLVAAVSAWPVQIADTRKTTPGLRMLEKYAVRCGGGVNHRFGLSDAVLIKDNHIAVMGGLGKTVEAVRQAIGHLVKIELEVDNLDQLKRALLLPLDAVMLDNMSPAMLREAVKLIGGRFITEASGGVTLANAAEYAATGVDVISSGWITHSAPILDVGLDAV